VSQNPRFLSKQVPLPLPLPLGKGYLTFLIGEVGVGVGPVYLGYMFETLQGLPPTTSNEIVTQRAIVITGRFGAFQLTKQFVTTELNNDKTLRAIPVN
jgi:hypothetical protein